MERLEFGTAGFSVSRLCLGTAAFGSWGGTTASECGEMLDRALDAGIDLLDTADVYSGGEAEEILGGLLAAGRRSRVILSTKVGMATGSRPGEGGNSRRWLTRAVEDSLRRLRTDHVDICSLHRPDPSCPIEETLLALTDLVAAGKIRHVGTSNFLAHELVEAKFVAAERGARGFVSEQPSYSIFTRVAERDVLPVCQEYGLAVIAWSPLAGGWLSGKYRRASIPDGSRRHRLKPERFDFSLEPNKRKLAAVAELDAVAGESGIDLVGLALGFALEHPAVTAVIIGPRTVDQLDSYLAGGGVRLDPQALDRIDAIVPPGSSLSESEAAWRPPALVDRSLRRRDAHDRVRTR